MKATVPATSGDRDLSELVVAVFKQWRAKGIEFLVLRNYENLPEKTGNDIDVLIGPGRLREAEAALVETAGQVGYRLHNRAEFSPVSLFFFQPNSLQQIQFDLFDRLEWRGFALAAPGGMLARGTDRGLYTVPHPTDEAILNLLTRLIYRGFVDERYRAGIYAGFQAHQSDIADRLAQLFGPALAGTLVRAVLSEQWDRVVAHQGALRRQLIWRSLTRRPLSVMAALLNDLRRFCFRLLRPPGVAVVLVGADGCGKSTAADGLTVGLRGTFQPDKSIRVHWKPSVFFRHRRSARPATTDPHGQPPRGLIASALALCYHWVEFLIGVWVQFLPVRFRNGLVLIDRYHYDFVVDPRRFRLRGLPLLARFLFRWLPAPELVFVLDAEPEVLQSRKREVPIEETRRQRSAYRDYVGGLPNARIVDASRSIEAVVAELTRLTLEHMAIRQQQRRRASGN